MNAAARQIGRILEIRGPVTWADLLRLGILLRVRFEPQAFSSGMQSIAFSDVVYYPAAETKIQQIHSVCHALGHLILHAQPDDPYYCPFGDVQSEMEAECFAESLIYLHRL